MLQWMQLNNLVLLQVFWITLVTNGRGNVIEVIEVFWIPEVFSASPKRLSFSVGIVHKLTVGFVPEPSWIWLEKL